MTRGQGQRSEYITREALILVRQGEDLPDLVQALDRLNMLECRPPLPLKEVKRIASSAFRQKA